MACLHRLRLFCLRKIQTLTNPSLPLLLHHHHHRHHLLSTSNSNNPSPSILRELREAINQISSSLSDCDPTSSTFPSVPSKEELDQNVPTVDNKLEKLKVSVLSLRHQQAIDRKRIWDMDDSRVADGYEIKDNFAEYSRQLEEQPHLQTREKIRNDIDTFITRLTRVLNMTMEIVQVAEVLTKSRLASLEEIIENLSQLRKDLQKEDFDELIQGLMKGKDMEIKELESVAEKANCQLPSLENLINDLSEIQR